MRVLVYTANLLFKHAVRAWKPNCHTDQVGWVALI